MHWTIEKLYSPPVLLATAVGRWNWQKFAEMVDHLSREKLKYPFCNILVDDTELEWDVINPSDMNAITKAFTVKDYAFAHTRIAFLMYSIDDFFAAYQFQLQTEPASTAVMKVFYERSTALEWLTIRQT